MDDLKILWGEIRNDQELELLTHKSITDSIRSQSNGTLSKLKRKVWWRFCFCVLLVAVLTLCIPFVGLASIQILLSVLMSAYLIGSVLLYQEYRFLNGHYELGQNLLGGLKAYRDRIKKVLKFEEIISLILYPISATAGFLVGMYLFDSKTGLLNEPKDWFLLLVPMIVLTPVSYLMNKWINRQSFHEHLLNLKKHIEELEYGS